MHPGSERHVDLLHVDWPASDGADTVPLESDVTPRPAGGQDILDPGAHEISVEVRARNADAIRYVIPVSWTGSRSDKAAVWDHLRVEPPRSVR